MFFKRPKTSNNFGFYFDQIVADENEDNQSKEEDFDLVWNEAVENPVYFWLLVIIFEQYVHHTEEPLELGLLGEVEGYSASVETYDDAVWNDNSLWDFLPYKDSYCLLLWRITYLTRAFFAFDIKRLTINGYPDEISKDFLKSYFSKGDTSKITDNDCEYIYHFLGELGKIDSYLSGRRIIKMMRPRDFEEERRFSSDSDEYEIYPNPEGEYHSREERWEKTGEFGKYMQIEFEFNKGNMKKLYDFIEGYISDTFDEVYGIEDITRKFIALAKKSEIIGNTVFIKFSDAISADFPCLQYIYWLNKSEGAYIDSWKIKDSFMVQLFDPTICHILGISDSPKQQADTGKISYNEKKEFLEFNGKKLGLGLNNEGFIKEYFDLMFDIDGGVSIDEIVERLEPNIDGLGAEQIQKKKKSLSYDRVNLLNKKIARLTGITRLFKIENGFIKLTSEIRVEK